MLEVLNLGISYGEKAVLRSASLCIEKGKITSLVGVNGCGKSTLLKTIVGILKPETGEIRIDGESLFAMDRQRIATKIAYLSQGRETPDMTVGQMVLHGRFAHLHYPRRYTENDRRIAREVMEKFGIEHLFGVSLSELSGGMRQSVYIAMALAQGSDYILLDEPTTYLDISHQIEAMRRLRALSDEGKGVLCVMHDLALAFSFSDEILLLNEGEIVLRGTPNEVCCSPLIKEIFGVELCPDAQGERYFCRY